ncbi:hypothetical protein [Aeromicrobium sp. Leaf350]|uniref:hypothetical protein n=1 Tax=Aeromicrobium sp. Leaf350 TaxID=2876565 RepID=UPI001E4E5140|nr:hypothetical protein [Aeromicrobium sp. Leaf350]
MSTVHVVIGPRTQVGAALLEQLAGQDVVAVARHDRDVQALGTLAEARVALSADAAGVIAPGTDLAVHVCALGPIHPEDPTPDDATHFDAELAAIDALVGATTGRVRIVLVSTVIALAPTPDRRLYGGWKNLAEEHLDRLALRHGDRCSVTVLYPGRIIAPSERQGLGDRLSSTFQKVARRMLAETSRSPRRAIIGVDAKLWTALRAMSLVVHVVRPSRTPKLTTSSPSTSTPHRQEAPE